MIFTFLILITLLNDIFEFHCDALFALTCSSAPVSTTVIPVVHIDLVFVQSVALDEAFMTVIWFLLSFLTVAPTIKSVAMTILLVLTVLLTLALYYISFPVNKLASLAKRLHQLVQSKETYTYINKAVADASVPATTVLCYSAVSTGSDNISPYDVCLGDLFNNKEPQAAPKPRKLSYADAVGYDHMEVMLPSSTHFIGFDVYLGHLFPEAVKDDDDDTCTAPPCNVSDHEPEILGYDVYLGDLFIETFQVPTQSIGYTQALKLPLSYADAVGYEHMQVRRPRNPNVVGYANVYLGDLFPEIEDHVAIFEPQPDDAVTEDIVPVRRYSFLSLKAKKAQELLEDFAFNDSFGSMANLISVEEICDLGTCESVYQKIAVVDAVEKNSSEDAEQDTIAQSIEMNESISGDQVQAIVTLPKLSYADAVGYEFMEVKRPRYPAVVGYEVDLSFLFYEEVEVITAVALNDNLELDIAPKTLSIASDVPASPSPRRQSYAKAVGYEHIEIMKPITSEVSLTEFITFQAEVSDNKADQEIPCANIQESSQEQKKKPSNLPKSDSFYREFVRSTLVQFAQNMWTESFYD